MMKPLRVPGALRVCALALSLCCLPLLAIPALAQNTQGNSSASQSTRQTTTNSTTQTQPAPQPAQTTTSSTTTTQQTSQPAQTTRVVERDGAASPTLYWVIGLGVLALVVIVAIVALGKRRAA
jgi:carbohydrate-binding DOMON domain-containing protein